MGEQRGFMDYEREDFHKKPVLLRVKDYKEFIRPWTVDTLRKQGSRCMDCGVPFCHQGCPLGNLIPEWNDLVSDGKWKEALAALLQTNNFPEFTGRICPAPCESACVLGINSDPVSIEAIEASLADMGFEQGWIKPNLPQKRSGKKVAIIGSGPAGLAAAQQLNGKGHKVIVYERADRPGGLLMYGIPDFKLEKSRVARRISLLEQEGIEFRCGINVGADLPFEQIHSEFDAVLLACGARKARDLNIPGRQLKGIHFAEGFLEQSTRRQFGESVVASREILATDKHVIVIGGGDTGSDCIGTSNRQGAKSVTQFEIMDKPPFLGKFPRAHEREEASSWPSWPYMLRTSSSHEEGVDRYWALRTKAFISDEQGKLTGLITEKVKLEEIKIEGEKSRFELVAIEGSEKHWPCDLALIAIGFEGPEYEGLLESAGIDLTSKRLVASDKKLMTNLPGVFVAGDMRRGQSLVVWAIAEGRDVAEKIDAYLIG
jgi:glutamate synthase (NADPH/NADH) small chain